jgi:predicted nuclease of predicted toxin-antitoxin system
MLPLLLDEGLPSAIAEALRAVEVDALAVGDVQAPPKQSSDETNIAWCREHGRLLVTNDRGKKDRVILDLLRQHHVHALCLQRPSSRAAPSSLASAPHAEHGIEDAATRRALISARLKPSGRLERLRR